MDEIKVLRQSETSKGKGEEGERVRRERRVFIKVPQRMLTFEREVSELGRGSGLEAGDDLKVSVEKRLRSRSLMRVTLVRDRS